MPMRNTPMSSRNDAKKPPKTARAARAKAGEGSIFDLLVADHRQVAALFDELKEAIEEDEPDADATAELLAKIDACLTPHARAEEQLVYPAFREGSEAAELPVAEGYEEHALIHQLVGELKTLEAATVTWCAKAKVMMDLVAHHVREEEGEQFTAARKGLKATEAAELGAQFVSLKAELTEQLGLPDPTEIPLPAPKRRAPAKA